MDKRPPEQENTPKKKRKKRSFLTRILLFLLALVLAVCIWQPVEVEAATIYNSGDVVEINSDEPIDRLYIMWDTVPGETASFA